MIIKQLIDEDFVNYKKPCMIIGMPYCNLKCDKECGEPICQNSELLKAPDINISTEHIIQRYIKNPITHAICFQGLEPLDSIVDVMTIVDTLRYRYNCEDDIVIYTGYTEEEASDIIDFDAWANDIHNVIVKYGRYIPNKESHNDCILGVNLASGNQYAKKYY